MQGTVKFFDAVKGFGFIAPDSGGADVFLHISSLKSAGLELANEGDVIAFEMEQDRRTGRGYAVALELIRRGERRSGRAFERSAAQTDARRSAPLQEPAGFGTGAVRWFDVGKGFGFIAPDAGGPDVFVHASALRRAGVEGLTVGQRVAYELERDARTGKIAVKRLRLGPPSDAADDR